MATQVTQCPKCQTSFRVTEAQLKIASGAVRCGSCLHIFHAPDHWLDSGVPAAAPETPPAATEPEPAAPEREDHSEAWPAETPAEPSDTDSSDERPNPLRSLDEEPEPEFNPFIEQSALDNIFSDDVFQEESLDLFEDDFGQETATAGDAREAAPRNDAIDDSFSTALEEDNAAPAEDPADDEDDLLISDDMEADDEERFGDTAQFPAIESDDGSKSLEMEEPEDTGEYSDIFLDIDTREEDQESVFKDLDEMGEEAGPDEEEWARKLLEEDDEDASTTPPPDQGDQSDDTLAEDTTAPPPPTEPDPFPDIIQELEDSDQDDSLDPELLDILNERDQTPSVEEPEQEEFVLGDEPMLAGERIGDEKRSLLAGIEPEPLVFASPDRRPLLARIGWSVGIVLAVLALGIQHVAFNFDRLARDDSYRELLAGVCGIVGCSLPERDDIRLIRSSNLIVRSHPKLGNALVVDAILTNRASFKQRFPDMELQFTSLSGEVIAGRRFSPREYLKGELEGLSMMPIRQPVHVSLEIVDPGEAAVNYRLRFHPQSSS